MTLEQATRFAWHGWAEYLQWGICGCCGLDAWVGRKKPSRRWLCLDCWDQGER